MNKLELNENVGRKLVAMDLSTCSPWFDTIMDANADENQLAATLQAKMEEVIKEIFGDVRFSTVNKVRVHPRTGIIKSPEERQAEILASQQKMAGYFEEAQAIREAEIENNPHNGTLGYWHVEGIRHEAIVKASSAGEAIKNASGKVSDWESPTAVFIGEEMPEVW